MRKMEQNPLSILFFFNKWNYGGNAVLIIALWVLTHILFS
jgi:hypothetical protein